MSIRIIDQPSIYLVGRQSIDDEGLSRFLDDHDVSAWETDTDVAGEYLVETAGRLCYMSFACPRPGGNAAYIDHILDVGHGSVIEHSVYNFIITGVSRSFSHEFVRHRVGISPSQLSQRFVDESDCAFVVPPALREEVDAALDYLRAKTGDDWQDDGSGAFGLALFHALESDCRPDDPMLMGLYWLGNLIHDRVTYAKLSDYLFEKYAAIEDKTARRKVAREAARSVLPSATETKLFITANARALRHFIELRGDPAADAEIRRVALAMLDILKVESENLFSDYVVSGLPDGSRVATTPHRKI